MTTGNGWLSNNQLIERVQNRSRAEMPKDADVVLVTKALTVTHIMPPVQGFALGGA